MNNRLYVLKVSLVGIEPEIWRRFVVPADIPLDHLHDIIQIVMGWEDRHLHMFTIGGKSYTEAPEELEEGKKERRFRLGNLVKRKGTTFDYLYDFGDSWLHHVTLENANYIIGPRDEPVMFLAGEGACPPEDVGSVPGYFEFCKAMKDPKHPDHKQYSEWYGKAFNPREFDWQKISLELLKYIRWSRPRLTMWPII